MHKDAKTTAIKNTREAEETRTELGTKLSKAQKWRKPNPGSNHSMRRQKEKTQDRSHKKHRIHHLEKPGSLRDIWKHQENLRDIEKPSRFRGATRRPNPLHSRWIRREKIENLHNRLAAFEK
ncbi:hypothetical protein L1887_22676 [Cichorium endivia]|nr:hypothetical protein L1887_22676 [Cichorium endivia]